MEVFKWTYSNCFWIADLMLGGLGAEVVRVQWGMTKASAGTVA